MSFPQWLKRRAFTTGTTHYRTKGRDQSRQTESDNNTSDPKEITLGRSMSELSEPPGYGHTETICTEFVSLALTHQFQGGLDLAGQRFYAISDKPCRG